MEHKDREPLETIRRLLDEEANTSTRSREILVIGGQDVSADRVVKILSQYLSPERAERIDRTVDGRTRTVVTVVEGSVNSGNVSAVMRSAEALGFVEFHLIATDQKYKHARRSSQGAQKWLDTRMWYDSADCLRLLKERGYRVLATSADHDGVPIEDVDFLRRTAIVFGNELEGVSKTVSKLADETVRLPMIGLVESYNISVAAALCLYHAYRYRVDRLGRQGDLDETSMSRLRAAYYLQAVQRGERIVL